MTRRTFPLFAAFLLSLGLTVPAIAADATLKPISLKARRFPTKIVVNTEAPSAFVTSTSVQTDQTPEQVMASAKIPATTRDYSQFGKLVIRLADRYNADGSTPPTDATVEEGHFWYFLIAPRLKVALVGNNLKLAAMTDNEIRQPKHLLVGSQAGFDRSKLKPLPVYVPEELRLETRGNKRLEKQLKRLEKKGTCPVLYFLYSYELQPTSEAQTID